MEFYGVTWENLGMDEFDSRLPSAVWSPVVAIGVHDRPLGFAGVGVTRFVLGLWHDGDAGWVVSAQEIDATEVAVTRVDCAAAAFRLWGQVCDRDTVTVVSYTHDIHA